MEENALFSFYLIFTLLLPFKRSPWQLPITSLSALTVRLEILVSNKGWWMEALDKLSSLQSQGTSGSAMGEKRD